MLLALVDPETYGLEFRGPLRAAQAGECTQR